MYNQVASVNNVGPALPGYSPRELIEAREKGVVGTFYAVYETGNNEPALLSLDTEQGVVIVDTREENIPAFRSKRTAQRRMRQLRDELNEGLSPDHPEYLDASEFAVVPVHGTAILGAMYG